MKIWKLVAGILSLVLFIFVTFQSCAAGLSNALSENGESSGTTGIFVAILMLAGGIVSIATRKSTGKGGNIALIVLFGLAALIGFVGHGTYSDLVVWAAWCLINVIVAVIAMIGGKKKECNEASSDKM